MNAPPKLTPNLTPTAYPECDDSAAVGNPLFINVRIITFTAVGLCCVADHLEAVPLAVVFRYLW
jgi:hypothetical protein